MNKTILVLGATGTLGQPVSRSLRESWVSGAGDDAGPSKGAQGV